MVLTEMWILHTAWKVSKHGVFSDQKKLHIWTVFRGKEPKAFLPEVFLNSQVSFPVLDWRFRVRLLFFLNYYIYINTMERYSFFSIINIAVTDHSF